MQRYCYAAQANKLMRKADSGNAGRCYIPRSKPCSEDSQCRPGTSCHCSGPYCNSSFTCEPRRDGSPQNATDVAQMVQLLAKDLLHSLESGSIHGTLDLRSGVSSPYLPCPRVAQEMFHDVRQSFASAEGQEHKDSSRSGATFVNSFDGLFIAKLLPRIEEWDDLVMDLAKDLSKHATLCEGGDTSWPRVALGSTLLNLPVMAFIAGDTAWVVIPAAAAVRCYAHLEGWPPKGVLGAAADAKACPLGEPEYFDVKPDGAHSEQRASFLHTLAEVNFRPHGPTATERERSEWSAILQMLGRDAALLGDRNPPYVDYSLLFEVYRPETLDVSFTQFSLGCVVQRSGDAEVAAGAFVVCLTVIDFFLRFDGVYKAFESVLVNDKWEDYQTKVRRLGSCVGYLSSFGKATDSSSKRAEETAQIEQEQLGQPVSINEMSSYATVEWKAVSSYTRPFSNYSQKTVPALLSVTVSPDGLKYKQHCVDFEGKGEYLKMACGGIAFVQKASVLEGVSSHSVHCKFLSHGIRLLACKGWLIHRCKAAGIHALHNDRLLRRLETMMMN